MPLHQQLFDLLCVAACGHALARGASPERISACAIFAAFVLTNLLKSPHTTFFHFVEWRILMIDGGLLIALLAVALISARYWPLAMVTLHCVSVFAHLAKILDSHIWSYVYFGLSSMLSWPIILMLSWATERHRGRLRRYGVDFSWVWQLPAAYRAGWVAYERRSAPASMAG